MSLIGWRVLPSISALLICLLLLGQFGSTLFPVMLDKNLPFSEASPLFPTVSDFGTRLSAKWKYLAVQTGRADHQQPFKRLRKCLRQHWLVLWVVLALCTGCNPASVKLHLSQFPWFFAWSWCAFWKQNSIMSWYLGRCQQVDGKQGRDKPRLSEEHAPQALAAPPRCWCDALRKSFWHHTQASPSECTHSFPHSWVCQQVFVSACDPPEDHTSYV